MQQCTHNNLASGWCHRLMQLVPIKEPKPLMTGQRGGYVDAVEAMANTVYEEGAAE
tara:strand:- start:182 stop:349 length:168 start_codon:yes stop_codon:yes gene_type:complete